ncbi:MAG: hypothetical protein P3M73_00135 [Candidatus Hodgkinia cicadicola]|nr:MAG: hypothetical protein P3M73_00135 [Candidatus Hodgkinia cicadicola]
MTLTNSAQPFNKIQPALDNEGNALPKQNQTLLCYSAANLVTIKAPKKVPIGLIEARGASHYKLSNSLRTSLRVSLANQLLLNSLDSTNNIKIIKKVVKLVRKQAVSERNQTQLLQTMKPLTFCTSENVLSLHIANI